ncbi:MAG: DNA gyrase subunit A [Candidatus Jorgensenbacteria bacterium]
MDKEKPKETSRIEDREITTELRESYLDYAMSVIVSRALPDVRDGLKPVQRRILWAMWDSGLSPGAKFKKSANVVGEVLGKYHPHGDAAVYDALARMAQDFSLRYPLIDGQGNWGSIDGDAPAAMRYTEARLSKISEELLKDIEKETVDWQPNYDSSRKEPMYLPAKLPNLLINGTVGIAVGMATSVPPHNLGEVVEALKHLNANPDASVKDLIKFVPGPDFPTGGVIYGASSLQEAYSTGRGSVSVRAVAEIGEKKNGFQIVITEIPYQVNKSTLIEVIAKLYELKRIEGIRDIRDESDREGLRIVIDLKSGSSPQKVLNQLYEYSELQKNIYFNMLALVDGIQPEILSLKDILVQYLKHRKIVVRRRTEFDLKKAEERAHVLEGLCKALDSIDKVIAVIKKSKDREEAKSNLIKSFRLTAIQSDAILDMKLATLAALERKRIEDELKEKRKIIAELALILKNPKRISGIIDDELTELKKSFGGERRTKLVASGLKEFKEEDLIPEEDVIITLTRSNYIKRMKPSVFRTQARGGKGLIGFELKEEDVLTNFISASSHDNVLFFTDRGKVYQTKAYEIPVGTRVAKGKSIHNFLEIPTTEKITTVLAYKPEKDGPEGAPSGRGKSIVMATASGFVKKSSLKDFENVRRTGIIAIRLKADDSLKGAELSSGNDGVILVTALGQAIRFKEKEVRLMSRATSGVRAIRLKKGDRLIGLGIIRTGSPEPEARNQRLLVVTEKGFAKQTPLKDYKLQRRGGSGIKTSKIGEKTGPVIAAIVLSGSEEEAMVFSSKGQALRTAIKNIRTAGRGTQGVKIMALKGGDKLIGIVCL